MVVSAPLIDFSDAGNNKPATIQAANGWVHPVLMVWFCYLASIGMVLFFFHNEKVLYELSFCFQVYCWLRATILAN